MLNVNDTDLQVPPRRKLPQRVQQKDRIRAARHSHTHALPVLEHAMARDELGEAVDHFVCTTCP